MIGQIPARCRSATSLGPVCDQDSLNVTYLRWQVHSSYKTSHCRTRAEQTLIYMPMEPGEIPDHLCEIPDNVIAVHEDSHCRPVYQQQWPSVRDGNTPDLCIPFHRPFILLEESQLALKVSITSVDKLQISKIFK